MKTDLIEKIEALVKKYENMPYNSALGVSSAKGILITNEDWDTALSQERGMGKFEALKDCLNLLQSLPEPILCKAYYQYETFTHIEVNNDDLPEKFSLKDLEIYVKPKEK